MHYKYSLDGTISALTDALYKFLSLVGLLATIAANSNQRAMCLHITLIFHVGQGARAGVLTLVRPIKQHPVVRSTVVRYVILPHHGFERVHGFGISFAENINNVEGGTDEQCHDTLATTSFLDSGNVVRGSYDSSVLEDEISMKYESVTDFLSKPLCVNTFAWSTGNIKNTLISSFDVAAIIQGNTQWKNKLQGFSLLRGVACLRIQVNANPFQQGKLLIHFLPGEVNITTVDSSYVAMHNALIANKRMQPCVEVDCRDAVGVLEVPYIAPDNWYNLGAGVSRTWGTFYISVLSPLAVGAAGETTVDVSCYMYLCDAEVAAPLVPQMAGGPKRKFKAKTVGRKDIEAQEADALEMKPLSAGLKTAAKVAGVLGEVPMLSSVALPAAWALDLASGVASWLGWSKVPNNIQPTIVSQQYNRYLPNSEGVECGVAMGLRSDNKIALTDSLSVYPEDEMSFGFLKRVGTCVQTLNWTTSNAQDVVLLSQQIGPSTIYEQSTKVIGAHTVTYRSGPPIFYFCSGFGMYRGGIEVTIKIVKTDFHIGRLQLTWSPGPGSVTGPTGATDSMLALREVLDVRENNVFTFTLPYLLPRHYVDTTETMGLLKITVLNELRAPETCSGNVEILVYYRGADDFEFQQPLYSNTVDPRVNMPFSPQTADDLEVKDGVGGESTKSLGTLYGQACCGEQFVSIKQLLSRGSQVLTKTLVTNDNASNVSFWPWVRSVLYMTPVTGVLNGSMVGGDIMCMVAPLFAFYRGSANVQIQTTHADTSSAGRNNCVNCTLWRRSSAAGSINALYGGITNLGLTADRKSVV